MSWYKHSKTFLTKLDHNKFIYTIYNVATSQFTEMMKKAKGDPLPITVAVINNLQAYGQKMGLNAENITEILNQSPIQESNGSIIISWQDLPQKYKQQARQRAGLMSTTPP